MTVVMNDRRETLQESRPKCQAPAISASAARRTGRHCGDIGGSPATIRAPVRKLCRTAGLFYLSHSSRKPKEKPRYGSGTSIGGSLLDSAIHAAEQA